MKNIKVLLEDFGGLGVSGPGIANIDMPMKPPVVKRDKFASFDVFEVNSDVYLKCKNGKEKFKHWKSYIGEDYIGKEIREFAIKNPNKPIIVKEEKTGSMIFVRGSHLDFKRKN